ncbi:hypothetical protein ATK17_3971 [Branchiibius hedensis]|uniref:Uncharacterized protein n=1 Tax=Branchiibius hedensis TaxID=672460 RepID=A0A2Y9BP18_9MICO|nr:hypothetical protein [Branchiibius hedensis]PWJ22802.1 hypothetical protein ATK17_3971 [Branchiibius hedensis]SSA59151.1 hypothetical protein SAMN04489750_3971 [Branchiibius hedensis]
MSDNLSVTTEARLRLNDTKPPTWGELRRFVALAADLPDDEFIGTEYDDQFLQLECLVMILPTAKAGS